MRDGNNANNNIALNIIKKHIVPQLTADNISKAAISFASWRMPEGKLPMVAIRAAVASYLQGKGGILSSIGFGAGAILDSLSGSVYKSLNEITATNKTTVINNTIDLSKSVY